MKWFYFFQLYVSDTNCHWIHPSVPYWVLYNIKVLLVMGSVRLQREVPHLQAVFRIHLGLKLLAHNRKPPALLSGVASSTWQLDALRTSGEVSPISWNRRGTLAGVSPESSITALAPLLLLVQMSCVFYSKCTCAGKNMFIVRILVCVCVRVCGGGELLPVCLTGLSW